MDRPTLQALPEDIRSGQIDCAVVYKVDRLSRSLLDFARLVDLFEQHEVSFVSVSETRCDDLPRRWCHRCPHSGAFPTSQRPPEDSHL